MTIDHVVLLTGEIEGPYLTDTVRSGHNDLEIRVVHDADSLTETVAELAGSGSAFRLISFATDIIVPANVIESLPVAGYNFHAGPPEYPGSCPACFAVHENASEFGVTAHELAVRVDSGAIVAVRRFPIAEGITATDLMGQAYQALTRLFSDIVGDMIDRVADLPAIDEGWRLPARTRSEALALASSPPDESDEDADRQRRAFGHLLR